jgi:hypothetical protein
MILVWLMVEVRKDLYAALLRRQDYPEKVLLASGVFGWICFDHQNPSQL